MAELPHMQFYVGDYMADTTHLSTVEHGAYVLLIFAYWLKGEALPNDDDRLARITKMQVKEWKKVRPIIEEFFVVVEKSLIHPRIEQELELARAKVANAAKAGRASAAQRKKNARSTGVQRSVQRANQRKGNQPEPEPLKPPYPLREPTSDAAFLPPLNGGKAAGEVGREAVSIGQALASLESKIQ